MLGFSGILAAVAKGNAPVRLVCVSSDRVAYGPAVPPLFLYITRLFLLCHAVLLVRKIKISL